MECPRGATWRASYEGPPLPSGLPQCFLAVAAEAWASLDADRRARAEGAVESHAKRSGRALAWREHGIEGDAGEAVREAYVGPVAWGGELHLDVVRALPRRFCLRALDVRTGALLDPRPRRPPKASPAPEGEDDADELEV